MSILLTQNPLFTIPINVTTASDIQKWYLQYKRPVMGEIWKIRIARKDKANITDTKIPFRLEYSSSLIQVKIKNIAPGKVQSNLIF